MNKDNLLEILLDQKESFNRERYMIERDINLQPYLSTSLVVIISGARRCGKSSLLYLIKQKLKLNDSEYCYCNLDDERIIANDTILDSIYRLHIERHQTEPVFFFDEIQSIPRWEKFINRMYEQGRKIFVTGSNSSLLSSEISTSLTGRNKVIEIFPFSFIEYCRYIKHNYSVSELSTKQRAFLMADLNKYMEMVGFPVVAREQNMELVSWWFQDILYRDIISRFHITQTLEIKQIALYLLSNIGKLFSYSTLQSIAGIKSVSSVKTYLDYLEMSYMLFYLKKFDYSVKKQIMNSRKVYALDNALCNTLGFHFSENKGRLMENLVFVELKRRRKEIFYYSGKYECDFVIRQGIEITEAIQVVYNLNEENEKRELAGLKLAMSDLHIQKGIVLYYEKDSKITINDDTIEMLPLYRWLLEPVELKN
ncbi:MAG: ATP-binding protein [Bacteroidales bacterium]|nr:ATP-binding protein [Bacteroidales bacterium]